jgi:hypothetical protein
MIARSFAALLLCGSVALADPAPVPCKTADDCWLDNGGAPIARPKNKRGHKIPRGSCYDRVWLDNQLSCSDKVCSVTHVPDRC